MRIISGTAGGITIKVPTGDTRPATDQVREAVFSMLGDLVPGARVLDLFAGSGAYGLEALSRGSTSATFVEQNGKACAVIQENLRKCRLPGAEVVKSEALAHLRRLAARNEPPFDLIFADPPYTKQKGDTDFSRLLLESAELHQLMAPEGILLLECMMTKSAPLAIPTWTVLRDRSYGSTRVLLFQPVPTPSNAEISGAADLQSPLPPGPGRNAPGSPAQDEKAGRPLE